MKRKINIILLTLSMILSVSCSKDFLDTKPTNAISSADALATPDNMMLVLNGLHRQMYAQSPLPGGSSSRTGQQYWMPMLDAIGGNVIHSSRSNGWHRSSLQWLTHTNATYTDVKNMWYQRYHFIASANSIINKVADDELTIDADMSNILGQAHSYRAWAYHQLVMTYAKGYLISSNPDSEPGVPLLLSTEAPYTSAPRSSVAEIYAQIEADINQAIAYFENASAPDNKSHISINAAYGIKARIALSKGDWATAASSAAMARIGYPLMDEATYVSGFNNTDFSEVIWGGKVIDTETTYYKSWFYFLGTNFNGSHNRGNPKLINKEAYDKLPATDYRTKLWLPLAPNTNSSASNGQGGSYETDPNYDNAEDFKAARDAIRTKYGMTSGHNTHPYMSVKYLNKNPGSIDPDDVFYMRSSEMYLIEAEAKAMLNDIGGAQEALAVLGKERDSAFDETIFDTQEKLMDQIKLQREIELWGEGFSYHDHIRWDMGIDQSNSGASQVLYNDGFMQDKPSVNNAWVFQIPQAEIDANPNLTAADQNPR